MMQKKVQPFAYDPMIIPRVKQYLEENVHQTYVDVGVMARELQQRYREYNRRKSGVFRTMVEQAYRTVLHSYGLDSNPSSENDDEALSDVEVMDEAGAGNSRSQMNEALSSMYMNNRNRPTGSHDNSGGAGVDQEAIDISSDEEEQSPSEDRAGGEKSNIVQTFVTANKHVTVTKVTRTNNTREDESTNGSAEGAEAGGGRMVAEAGDKYETAAKRRRLESDGQTLAQQLRNHYKSTRLMSGTDQQATRPGNKSSANSKAAAASYQNGGNNGGGGGGGGGPAQRSGKKYRKEIVPRLVTTTFDDIGGMDRILKDLCELLLHVKHPEIYRHIGLPPPRGFLLHGPPGSGKTLLARSIAGQLKIELIEVPATELIAGVSGESEERIRDVFEQAAANAPCVLFIDEIDAISSNRINAQRDMERRVVAQLLSSLDSLGKMEGGEGVIVIGATNRADVLDPALRRVGRFDQEISLGIPDRAARMQILRIICRKLKIADTIDYSELAKLTPGYVGADLLALATRAANTAIKRLFTLQQEKMLAREREDSDDVVAIDDEVDDVVNLDEEDKEEQKEQATEEPAESPKEAVDAGAAETNDTAEEQPASEKATEAAAPNESAEQVPTAEKPAEKESRTEEGQEGDGAEKMDVDNSTPPFNATEPTVVERKEEDNSVTTSSGVVMMEATSESEHKSPNGPTPAEVSETTVDATAAVAEQKTDGAESSAAPARKEENTLEQMMDILLNQQHALPAAELEGLCIEREDFLESLRTVQPSAKREGFITVPDVTWNDIGSLGDIREELKLAILAPVKFPARLKLLGLNAPSGVLLCGPPGCGKTLLAKAVANEAGINFISVKGPELLNMYVGESERAVRQCFQRARNSAPCVIFFDEFDSLCPKRSDTAEGSAATRVVNQLLTEMDGIEERKGVFLMAATNRPDIVDPAVLRPGRLDKILYVGLPALADRVDILRALTKNRTQPPLAADVEFEKVAEQTEGYTGADLAGLVRQASLQTLKESIVTCSEEEKAEDGDGGMQGRQAEEVSTLSVTQAHFLEAIRNIKPSVSAEDKKQYEKLRLKYGTGVGSCLA